MSVTRVLDSSGGVLHDCIANGCQVSWDGYAIEAFDYDDGAGNVTHYAAGDAMPGRSDPDPSVWTVAGTTAQRRPA